MKVTPKLMDYSIDRLCGYTGHQQKGGRVKKEGRKKGREEGIEREGGREEGREEKITPNLTIEKFRMKKFCFSIHVLLYCMAYFCLIAVLHDI